MQIRINNIAISEQSAKFFSGCSLKFNTEFLFERNFCAVKCNKQICGFSIYGLEIGFQTFHFYFLDMDGETLLKFNHGDIYKADDLDEAKHWFVVTFLKQEMDAKRYEIERLMRFI